MISNGQPVQGCRLNPIWIKSFLSGARLGVTNQAAAQPICRSLLVRVTKETPEQGSRAVCRVHRQVCCLGNRLSSGGHLESLRPPTFSARLGCAFSVQCSDNLRVRCSNGGEELNFHEECKKMDESFSSFERVSAIQILKYLGWSWRYSPGERSLSCFDIPKAVRHYNRVDTMIADFYWWASSTELGTEIIYWIPLTSNSVCVRPGL